MRIKDMPENERPRERFAMHDAKFLSDSELLAIIIGTGTTTHNPIDISNQLIKKIGIKGITKTRLSEMLKIRGLGKVKTIRILAAIELSKRIKNEPLRPKGLSIFG